MRFASILIFYMFFISSGHSQQARRNLILNGSFEVMNIDTCYQRMVGEYWAPNFIFPTVPPWYGSEIHFNSCQTNNCMGSAFVMRDCPGCRSSCPGTGDYPLPLFGKNYVFTYQETYQDGTNWGYPMIKAFERKFISVGFTEPLKANFVYKLTYYVNNFSGGSVFNCYDAYFTEDTVSFRQIDTIVYTNGSIYYAIKPIANTGHDLRNEDLPAQIRYTGTPLARGQWYRMEADYTAKGGEKHITLGCLRKPLNYTYTDNPMFSTVFVRAYFDSISLVEWVNQRATEGRIRDNVIATPIDPIDTTQPPVVEQALKIPNVITPNGDGLNDYWVIDGLPEGSAVVIHNRWGNTVFSEAPYRHRFSAEGLEAGTYFYLITEPNGTFHKGPLRVIKE